MQHNVGLLLRGVTDFFVFDCYIFTLLSFNHMLLHSSISIHRLLINIAPLAAKLANNLNVMGLKVSYVSNKKSWLMFNPQALTT